MSTDAASSGSGAWHGAADPAAAARPWSLLVRLAWIATAAVLVSLMFGGFAMFRAASIENDQMHESRLEQFGATIQAIVESHLSDVLRAGAIQIPHLKTRPTAALLYRYQVWSRHGSLLLRSHEAPAAAPMTDLRRFGYSTVSIDGEEHRVFSLPSSDGEFIIQVAENINEVWSQAGVATLYYVGFLLIPFGLVLAATWLLLRRALHSINTLAGRLQDRNPLDVTHIPVVSPPREMVPILRALDMLFARMQHALSIERSFTSLAAHEMRTPLAGLRAQAQLLTRAGLPEAPMETVGELIKGVDRAAHLLEQLLDLARIEGITMTGEEPAGWVDIAEAYEEVMLDLAPRLLRRQVTVTPRFDAEGLSGHGFALTVLLRNLLSNAVLYTPQGGRVELRSSRVDGGVMIAVDDSGLGIPAPDRERAFERFNRLGRNRVDGVGLGLSIVLSVVELHRARIQLLDSHLGGLRVQVVFPLPPQAGEGVAQA